MPDTTPIPQEAISQELNAFRLQQIAKITQELNAVKLHQLVTSAIVGLLVFLISVGVIRIKGDPGETGERGLQGIQGVRGEQGTMGPHGPRGDRGETGLGGPRGPMGPSGEQGPPGPRGAPGDSIPVGACLLWLGTVRPHGPYAPAGYAVCDGKTISEAMEEARVPARLRGSVRTRLKTMLGSADTLPDLRGTSPRGCSANSDGPEQPGPTGERVGNTNEGSAIYYKFHYIIRMM